MSQLLGWSCQYFDSKYQEIRRGICRSCAEEHREDCKIEDEELHLKTDWKVWVDVV